MLVDVAVLLGAFAQFLTFYATCAACVARKAESLDPQLASLPRARRAQLRPFTHTRGKFNVIKRIGRDGLDEAAGRRSTHAPHRE